MSDKQYDDLYDELKSLEDETGYILSNSPTQKVQGEVIDSLKKVTHIKPMLSSDKTKSLDEIRKFMGKHDTVQSYKLDGLTCVVSYRNGKLYQAVTRGDGYVGEDVTHTFKHCKNIPIKLAKPVDVTFRGECLIPWDTFREINETLDEPYSHPRNLAAGTLRQLDGNIAKQRGLEYYVFEVIEGYEGKNLTDSYEYAESLGMPVVEYRLSTDLYMDFNAFNPETYRLPVDGIIYKYNDLDYGKSLGTTGHHPLDMMALKWEDELYNTKLIKIEWNTSRTGLINPVAVFAPVDLGGAITTRATLHNISYIEDLQLGDGDTILVYRANMVIPKVHDNLTRSNTWKLPDKCPVCGGDVEVRNANGSKSLHCLNPNCSAKLLSRLVHAVSRNALNIEGLSESTLEKMISHGWVKSIKDIYHIDEFAIKLAKLDGFGVKSVNNLIASIDKSRHTTLDRLIYAQSIPLIGRSASKDIAKTCDYDINKFTERLDSYGRNAFSHIDGFGIEMGKWLKVWWIACCDEFMNLSTEFYLDNPIADATKENFEKKDLSGNTFVITGSLRHFNNRDKLKEELELRGAKVSGSVTSKTTYLINNDINSTSSKNKKAKQLGIPIITEEQVLKML